MLYFSTCKKDPTPISCYLSNNYRINACFKDQTEYNNNYIYTHTLSLSVTHTVINYYSTAKGQVPKPLPNSYTTINLAPYFSHRIARLYLWF